MKLRYLAVLALLSLPGAMEATTPTFVSLTPSSGSGSGGDANFYTFTAVVSDSDGVADLQGMNLLFYDPAQSDPNMQMPCWTWYNRSDNTIWAYHANTGWNSGPAGGAGPNGPLVSGNFCAVDTSRSSASVAGNNLTFTAVVTFDAGYWNSPPGQPQGPETLQTYLRAVTNSGVDTGYNQMGTWTLNPGTSGGPDFSISFSPSATPLQSIAVGSSMTYTVTVSGFNGFNGTVTLAGNAAPSSGYSGPTLNATFNPPTITGSGSSTMTIPTVSSTPPGLYRVDIIGSAGNNTHNVTVPLAISNAAPTVSMSPSPGTGSSQTFTFITSDFDSADNINGINILLGTDYNGTNACWMFYDPNTNNLWLASNDQSSWTPIYFGSAATAQNSQCTVAGSSSSLQDFHQTGTRLILTIPITFSSNFSGTKTVYMRAVNRAGFDSGYLQTGTWTVP